MERTYFLDLPTLAGYMRGKAAIFRTTLSPTRNQPGVQGIIFHLQAQNIQSYLLSSAGELLATGDKAYQRLSQCKEWQVRIDTEVAIRQEWLNWLQQHNLTHLAPSVAAEENIPRPRRPVETAALSQFTVQQAHFLRTVYSQVNGQRTVTQIQERLSQWSPQAVEEALHVLYTLGLID